MYKERAHAVDVFARQQLSVLIVCAKNINTLAKLEIESVTTGF